MFDRQLFAASLEAKLTRNKLSLREAAKQCGVSASTLSRLLRGESPDIEIFGTLCEWMGESPGAFFSASGSRPQAQGATSLGLAMSALRSDEHLPVEVREALVDLVKVVYSLGQERQVKDA